MLDMAQATWQVLICRNEGAPVRACLCPATLHEEAATTDLAAEELETGTSVQRVTTEGDWEWGLGGHGQSAPHQLPPLHS